MLGSLSMVGHLYLSQPSFWDIMIFCSIDKWTLPKVLEKKVFPLVGMFRGAPAGPERDPPNIKHLFLVPIMWKIPTKNHGISKVVFNIRGMGLIMINLM